VRPVSRRSRPSFLIQGMYDRARRDAGASWLAECVPRCRVPLPDELLPLVDVIPPNAAEAAALTDIAVHDI
jgi:hypothetical protein